MLTIITENGISELLQLKKDASTFDIPTNTTVKAAIVSYDRATLLAGPFTMLSGDAGAAWGTSLVSLIVASSLTTSLTVGKVRLEVKVEDTNDESWFYDAEIVKGNIT